jgi:hypothetical protein
MNLCYTAWILLYYLFTDKCKYIRIYFVYMPTDLTRIYCSVILVLIIVSNMYELQLTVICVHANL